MPFPDEANKEIPMPKQLFGESISSGRYIINFSLLLFSSETLSAPSLSLNLSPTEKITPCCVSILVCVGMH